MAVEAFTLNPCGSGGRKSFSRNSRGGETHMAKRYSATGVAWKQMVKKYGVAKGAKLWKHNKGAYKPSIGRFVHNANVGVGMTASNLYAGLGKKSRKAHAKHAKRATSRKVSISRWSPFSGGSFTVPARPKHTVARKAGGGIKWGSRDGAKIIKYKAGRAKLAGVRVPASYKFRPNPDGFADSLKSVYSVNGLKEAAPYGLGALAAWSLPTFILPKVMPSVENKGFVGYACNLASATLLGGAIGLITKKWNFAAKVMLGGIVATGIRVIVDNLPKQVPIQMSFVAGTGLMGQSNLRAQIERQVTKELAKSGMLGFTAQDIQNAAGKGVTMADEDVQIASLRYEDVSDNY